MKAEHIKQVYTSIIPESGAIQDVVIEKFKEGVIILFCDLQLAHLNPKAEEIYQQLWSNQYASDKLPSPIAELLNWLGKNDSSEGEVFVMDYQLDEERIIRIRVCLLDSNCESEEASSDRPWLLLFLEDLSAVLQDELRIEQKKYDLSDRELEVLSLLSRSFSYQEIANRLQVSLNTVKFHVKKINLKKQSYSKQNIILQIDKQ